MPAKQIMASLPELHTQKSLRAFSQTSVNFGGPFITKQGINNGTNFVGGSNELKELEALDKKKLQDATVSHGVTWHFNPPLTPPFSGVHEIMIKAAKKAIYAILNCADIMDEELLSAVAGAEGFKCYYDQILDIHIFTFSHTIGVSKISCQMSIYYKQQNSCFFNLSFREFTAAINFPCSKSGLRIGENDIIFSKIPHGLKL